MNLPKNKSVILFFIDGLGIGNRGKENPLSIAENLEPLAHFIKNESQIPFDGLITPTDPRLGIEGRPQSASGQTTILTGINAPKLLGYHKQGFPNAVLREVIRENSLFLQLKKNGIEKVNFVNTYTPQFFQETPRWKSATTVAVESADMRFNKIPDLLGRKSLFHDFTNQALIDKGFDVPLFSIIEAAEILANLTQEYSFVLYEHFITDKIGHDQDFEKAKTHLPKLAEFIRETLKRINLETTTFLTAYHF